MRCGLAQLGLLAGFGRGSVVCELRADAAVVVDLLAARLEVLLVG